MISEQSIPYIVMSCNCLPGIRAECVASRLSESHTTLSIPDCVSNSLHNMPGCMIIVCGCMDQGKSVHAVQHNRSVQSK